MTEEKFERILELRAEGMPEEFLALEVGLSLVQFRRWVLDLRRDEGSRLAIFQAAYHEAGRSFKAGTEESVRA